MLQRRHPRKAVASAREITQIFKSPSLYVIFIGILLWEVHYTDVGSTLFRHGRNGYNSVHKPQQLLLYTVHRYKLSTLMYGHNNNIIIKVHHACSYMYFLSDWARSVL